MEEAAASLGASRLTTFRRIMLPNLAARDRWPEPRCPSPGPSSEFGATVLISGNMPVQDPGRLGRDLRPDRERRPSVAAAVSAVLLAALARGAARARSGCQRWGRRRGWHRRRAHDAAQPGLRAVAIFYVILLLFPARADRLAHLRARPRPGLGRADHSVGACTRFKVTSIVASWRSSPTRSSVSSPRSCCVRHQFPGRRLLNALIDLPDRGLAGRGRPGADPGLRQVRAPSAAGSHDHGIDIIFSLPAW